MSSHISRDISVAQSIDFGGAAASAAIADQRLWFGDTPAWAVRAWEELKEHLLRADEGWEVRTDWYEDRLAGRPGIEALEFARAMIRDEDWNKGPAHVDAIIKRLIAEHTAAKFPAAEILTFSTETGMIGLVPPEITGADLYEQTCDRVLNGLSQFSSSELANQYAAARDTIGVLDSVLRNHRRSALLVHARIVSAHKERARLIAVDVLPANDFRLTTLQGDLADGHLDIEDAVPLVREAVERRAKGRMRAPDEALLEEVRAAADKLVEAADEDAALLAGEGRAALDRVAPGQPIGDEADKHAIYTLGWMIFRVPKLRRHLAKIAIGAAGVGALHQALVAAEALYLRLYHLFY